MINSCRVSRGRGGEEGEMREGRGERGGEGGGGREGRGGGREGRGGGREGRGGGREGRGGEEGEKGGEEGERGRGGEGEKEKGRIPLAASTQLHFTRFPQIHRQTIHILMYTMQWELRGGNPPISCN